MPDALAVALAYVNRRERTVAEVEAKLRASGFDGPELDAAIAELIELGSLDDRRYARLFVEDKRALEGWGRERIARGLAERGIASDLIAHTLTAVDADDELTELERAVELLGRRFPGGPATDRDRERAYGFLARKGYGSEVAADAVRAWRRTEPGGQALRTPGAGTTMDVSE